MNSLKHPWALSGDEVVQSIRSANATSTQDSNILREQKKISNWVRFFNQLKSPVVITLLIATFISAILGEMVDSIAIASIVIINSFIGYAQEAKAEAAVAALKKLSSPKARVLRSESVIEISSESVRVGDILVFEAGDYVAADARLIEANQLSIDESLLTGESMPVKKNTDILSAEAQIAERTNMIFASTAVSTGSGRAVVTAIGMETEIGHIAGMLESAQTIQTPLQSRLKEVGSKLLLLCVGVVTLVGILGLIHGERWIDVLMTAISLAVAAIPEGLPAVVTLALALAVHRLTRKNAIIRHLPAVETLGSTDVICTDKTGTLTTGKMRVREVVLPDGKTFESGVVIPADFVKPLIESAVLCSNASVNVDGISTGDPTEVALLYLAVDQNLDPAQIQKNNRRLHEWSFESVRKRMSVATERNHQITVHVKGAPESLLPLCRMSDDDRKKINEELNRFSQKGRRMLAIASRTISSYTESSASVECDLNFLGLVAIADPPRPESIDAIQKCKASGIKVVMITGDHPATAKAIAQELGIIEVGKFDGVLTGVEIDAMDTSVLADRIGSIAVYARVAPEHKFRIVEAWKAKGNVVAMTGDGVNDAPALKAASIGVAMGKGGTEVARQASSMILVDDNFATIVGAIAEGRAIFGNIRRTIQYLLSGNLSEILIMLGAAAMGWPAPLAPIHLLWINLVTDGLPSLALAAEPVAKDILETSSRPSPKNFFSRGFYKEIGFIGIVVSVMALVIYGYSLGREGELTARTHVFSFLVFAELFRSFACRSETKTVLQLGLFSNIYHLLAVSAPIAFQLLLHHTIWFEDVFKVHMISWGECLFFIALTLLPITALEVRKLILQKRMVTL